ncbi:hypothetical protein GCM10022379_35380 [Micromonospora maritima]
MSELRGRSATSSLAWHPSFPAMTEVAGPVRARPPAYGVGQLAAQVTAGTALVPFQLAMKPKLVLAPAPSRPL